MVYAPKVWADGAPGNTPITAAELNRVEQGVADAHRLAEDAAGLPPLASSAEAGLMSPTHFQLVDGATENFSNNTIVRRSSTGGVRATFSSWTEQLANLIRLIWCPVST